MRISDWSSDVCSSDLAESAFGRCANDACRLRRHRTAYRPLAWRGRSRGEGGARSFTGRHAARGFAVAIVSDYRAPARGDAAIDQAIGLLVLVDRTSTRLKSSH